MKTFRTRIITVSTGKYCPFSSLTSHINDCAPTISDSLGRNGPFCFSADFLVPIAS